MNNHTDDTLASDRRALARWLKSLPSGTRYCDLDPDQPRDYLIAMQTRGVRYTDHPNRPPVEGGLSPFTVRKEVNVLKAFGTWLKTTKRLRDPFASLPRPKVPKKIVTVLEPDGIRALIDALNTNTHQGARLYAIVMLIIDSGLRVSEVSSALLDDLDLERRQLKVMGKGKKERIVPFGDACAQALLNYIELHRPRAIEANTLILSVDGFPLTRGAIEHMVSRLKSRAGVKKLYPHLMRHTFGVRFMMNGGNQRALQNILGHSTVKTTVHYSQLSESMTNEAYRQIMSPADSIVRTQRRTGFRKRRPR